MGRRANRRARSLHRALATALLAGVVSLTAMGLGGAVAAEREPGSEPVGSGATAEDSKRPEPVCGRRLPKSVPGELRHPRATLLLAEGADTTINFGHDHSARVLRLDFTVEGCRFSKKDIEEESSLTVDATLPVDQTGDRHFSGVLDVTGRIRSPHDVLVEVTLHPSVTCDPAADEPATSDDAEGDEVVSVSSCRLDAVRTSPSDESSTPEPSEHGARPGTYSGFVEVLDNRRVNVTRIPFTVQLRYEKWWALYFSVTVPAVVLGTLATWFKAKDVDDTQKYWKGWWTNVRNWVGIGAGLAAARVAFQKGYFDDPDWGADLPANVLLWPIGSIEWWTLAVVVTTAFIGAMTPTTIGAEQIRKSRKDAKDAAAAAKAGTP